MPRRFIGGVVRGDVTVDDAAAAALARCLDWLRAQGLLPLLARPLRAARERGVRVPDALAAACDDAARRLAARELAIATPLRAAYAALAAEGIAVLVFKGEALAAQVYDAPATRERGDVDAWVEARDFERAGAVLARAGFDAVIAADGHEVQTERTYVHRVVPQLAIDLHRRAFGQGLLDRAVPFAEVYARALAHDGAVRRPDLADALVLAALHRIAHHADASDRALWLHDCDRIVRRDVGAPDLAAERALAGGVGAIVGDTLAATRAMFDTPVDDATLARLAVAAAHERSAALLRPMSRARRAWFDFTSLPDVAARARFVREHLLPSPRYLRARHPRAPRWALPLLYPWRLVTGIARAWRR